MDEKSSRFRFRSEAGGHYEAEGEFASGGVATVHLARYVSAGGISKIVAVKRLHAHHAKDPGLRAALLDEARVVASIQHPNVVSVLDVCEEDDEALIVMEYVHGVSLARLVKA